jgi:hypothetical protein
MTEKADHVVSLPTMAYDGRPGTDVPEPRIRDPAAARPAEIVSYADGPFLVRGPFEVVGEDGTKLTQRRVVALCGCGRSRLAPFCDGTHKRRRRRPVVALTPQAGPPGSI